MAAHPEDFVIEDGVLKSVSKNYIENNSGHINIPNSVSRIGTSYVNKVFSNYPHLVESVTIPISVTHASLATFLGCTNLKSLAIYNPEIEFEIFANEENVFFPSVEDVKDLEITITSIEHSEEKAQALKKRLQIVLPNIEIHIDNPFDHFKGDPTFFSQPNTPEDSPPPSPSTSPR